ncbi:MAG: right-handed parallel beta-helix repeat-containing protein [Candidatus Electrothrix sp. AR5]|nr:right-handed parallel beta-helix repeat-containing protein [Candidatus Electrothrix sp. AR5]
MFFIRHQVVSIITLLITMASVSNSNAQENISSTLHSGTISQNETWSSTNNPHIIKGQLVIAGAPPEGAVLTIEPGVIVKFMEGASMDIGEGNSPGTLQALGTHDANILFTSNQDKKTKGWWKHIRFNKQAVKNEINYCTVEYGGGYDAWNSLANIVIHGANGKNVLIKNSVITGSSSNGIRFADNKGLATITNNRITDNEKYGISLYPDQVRRVDAANKVANNATGGIQIKEGVVTHDATWHRLDTPYILNTITVGSKQGATLTVEAGVEIRFEENAQIDIGTSGKPGRLLAKGAPDTPIVFTSNQANKTKGWWKHIRFNKQAVQSEMEHCTVEYGGGFDVWNSVANIVIHGASKDNVLIKDCMISNSRTNGVHFPDNKGFATMINNRINKNTGYGISVYADQVRGINNANKVAHNELGGIQVKESTVTVDAVWHKLDAPYIVKTITIGSRQGATLTIEPGTQLRLEERAAIEIGALNSPGRLIARGMPDAPILFTSNQNLKTKGWWHHIRFNKQSVDNQLEYCIIEYGGGFDVWNSAADIVVGTRNGLTIQQTKITDSKQYGIKLLDEGTVKLDKTVFSRNESEDIYVYSKKARYSGALSGSPSVRVP